MSRCSRPQAPQRRGSVLRSIGGHPRLRQLACKTFTTTLFVIASSLRRFSNEVQTVFFGICVTLSNSNLSPWCCRKNKRNVSRKLWSISQISACVTCSPSVAPLGATPRATRLEATHSCSCADTFQDFVGFLSVILGYGAAVRAREANV